MKLFEVNGHASSLVPEGKEWKLVWADEFDGTELDRTKWDYRLSMMGKRHITWTDDGVSLDGDSNAVFRIFEKNGEICSSQLQTGYNFMDGIVEKQDGLVWPIAPLKESKYLKKYGYFECRCKLQKRKGWWSAFWIQSPIIGANTDPSMTGMECDIMESFRPGEIKAHAGIYGGYGANIKVVSAGSGRRELDLEEYHTFGVEWNEEGYTFYIDGEADGSFSHPISGIPQFILLSTEVDGYRTKAGTATEEARQAAAAGDTFTVDYVRVFDPIE